MISTLFGAFFVYTDKNAFYTAEIDDNNNSFENLDFNDSLFNEIW